MNSRSGIVLAMIAGAIVLAALSAFTVDQRQRAIVFQLGEIKDLIDKPGLYFKIPLIQNVRYFDKRILTLDTPDTERFITSEKKNVLDAPLDEGVDQDVFLLRGDDALGVGRIQRQD